jgi:putative addiction module component (TIGR02574 family)
MKLADFPDVQRLSTEEKLQLVDELWLSMGTDLDELEVTPEEKKILDERWAEFEKNPDSALTLEEAKSKLAARTR